MRPTTTASNLFRRALCPGSARMEEGLPEEDSELSREGQLLHDYSAHPEYNRAMLKPNQKDLVDLADKLSQTVIDRVEAEAGYSEDEKTDYAEKTMELGEHGEFGTPDFARYYMADSGNRITALVIDRKFGFNVVERAELNLQLRAYAVLAYDFADARRCLPKEVYVAIVQPRAPYDERITLANYFPTDIEAATEQIFGILKESNRPEAQLVAGEEQCRYCKAKMICPAFKEMFEPFEKLAVADSEWTLAKKKEFHEKKLAEITDGQVGYLLQAVRFAAFIKDALSDEARKRITAGGMTDFTVAKDAEVREIANVRRAMSLLSLADIPKLDIYECITGFSVTKLAEVIRKMHPTWTSKQATDWVNFKLSSVIEFKTRKGKVMSK